MGFSGNGAARRSYRRGIQKALPIRCGARSLYLRVVVCRFRADVSLRDVAPASADGLVLASRLGGLLQAALQKTKCHQLVQANDHRFRVESVHLAAGKIPLASPLVDHVGLHHRSLEITFPLVFGWLMFESVPGDLDSYRIYVFGFATTAFKVESIFGFVLFHGLVWAALLVIPGVMIAMHRRMRDEGAVSVQFFREDILPLVLLFAVSLTGLLLTVSATWLRGYGYEFLSITHAATIIVTLLWLPFGKFFHVFQRPAQIGVSFYKDVARAEETAKCRRCGHAFSSRMHVEDLIKVLRELVQCYIDL
jgi:hypothetical protein